VPAQVAAAPASADVPDSAGLRRLWPDVLDQVRPRSRRTKALLDNVSIAAVDGTVIKLAATSAAIAKMISDESNLSVLQDSLAAVIGGGWRIEVVVDQGPAGLVPAAAVAPTNGRATPVRQPPPPPADDDGVDEDGDEVSGLAGIGGDPEAVAIALLQDSLGARQIEGR
jgi:DNA polymerase-3 subunit gamma/tau